MWTQIARFEGGMSMPKPLAHEWLKEYRLDKKIRQEDVERFTSALGPRSRISQSHLSKIERGNAPLIGLGAERIDALRQALGLSLEEWLDYTGIQIATAVAELPEAPAGFPEPLYKKRDEIYMPEGLLEAIRLFGDVPEYADLKLPDVQRQLANHRGFDGGPQTAGQWLAFFQANKPWITNKD